MILEVKLDFVIENEMEKNINSLFDRINFMGKLSDKNFLFKKIDNKNLDYILKISANSIFQFDFAQEQISFQPKYVRQKIVQDVFNSIVLDALTFAGSFEEFSHRVKWNGCSVFVKDTKNECLSINFDSLSGFIFYRKKIDEDVYFMEIVEKFDDSVAIGFISDQFVDIYELTIDMKVQKKLENEKYLIKYIL